MISGSRAALSMTGDAVGVHRRGHEVLGGAHAREVERDVGAVQAVGERLEVAVAELERGAHRLEAGNVHVDRTEPKSSPPGIDMRTCRSG
jgi:hypothetical protein